MPELSPADYAAVAGARIFRDVPEPDLKRLVDIAHVEAVSRGALLIEESQPSDRIFVILEGEVEFFLPALGGDNARPTRIALNTLGAGECFGEYSALDDGVASASCETTTASRLCVWSAREFLKAIEASDRLGRVIYGNIARVLVARLRRKDEELDLPLY
jgi:CRP-like cAMP-binding protein